MIVSEHCFIKKFLADVIDTYLVIDILKDVETKQYAIIVTKMASYKDARESIKEKFSQNDLEGLFILYSEEFRRSSIKSIYKNVLTETQLALLDVNR